MTNPEFVATHDYQHGGVAIIVKAESKEALENALGEGWEVFYQDIENHPIYSWCVEKGFCYNLACPSGLLAELLSFERTTKIGLVIPDGK